MSENGDIESKGEGQPLEGYLKNLAGGGKSIPQLEMPSEAPSLSDEERVEEKEERSSRKRFSQAFGKKREKEEGYGRLDEKKANKKSWWKGPIGCVVGLVAITSCCVITYYSTQISIEKLFEWRNLEKPAISEPLVFDSSGRQTRYLKFINPSAETLASRWQSGNWGEFNTQDLIDNLDPASPYDGIDGFMEFCPDGPIACFTDPAWIPEKGRPVVMDFLGLTPVEYEDYYSKRNKPTAEQQQAIIDRLHQKYDEKYPWLAPLFENLPTNLDSQDKSDWEKWWEKWHTQGSILDIHTTRDRIHAEGYQQWKTPWRGHRSTASINKGRGLGSTKGFS